MNPDRILLDTVYIQALFDRNDQHHGAAVSISIRVKNARQIIVTDAVLIEVANALSSINRQAAVEFIRFSQQTANVRTIPTTVELFDHAVALYSARHDKTWSLTDCISFVVMQNETITLAATADRHFVQAGFNALMIESS